MDEKMKKQSSKTLNLSYNKLEMQKYVSTNELSIKTKLILFKARNRMLNVENNYGKDINCPLCQLKKDDQKHLIKCMILKSTCCDILYNDNAKYDDLFSKNIEKQQKIVKLIEHALRKREEIMEKSKSKQN